MYTVLMKSDKSLVATSRCKIYQRESLADTLVFYLPTTYNDITISDDTCDVYLKYVDQVNVAHLLKLELNTDNSVIKEDYLAYSLKIDSGITQYAGDVVMRLTILEADTETDNIQADDIIINTGEIVITISPLKDMYARIRPETLDAIDKRLLELQATLEAADELQGKIDTGKADNIYLDTTKGEVYLTSGDDKTQVGDSITLNDLGDALADNTEDGLVYVVTDDSNSSDGSVTTTYSLNVDNNQVQLLSNGTVIETLTAQELGGIMTENS